MLRHLVRTDAAALWLSKGDLPEGLIAVNGVNEIKCTLDGSDPDKHK